MLPAGHSNKVRVAVFCMRAVLLSFSPSCATRQQNARKTENGRAKSLGRQGVTRSTFRWKRKPLSFVRRTFMPVYRYSFLAHRSTGSNGFVWMSRRRGFSDLNASDRGGVNPVFSLNAYITMLGVTCISLLWRKFTFANFKLKIPLREESIILVQSLISMEPMCHPLTSTTDQNRLKCLLESGFLPLTLCLTVSSLHIFDTDGFF